MVTATRLSESRYPLSPMQQGMVIATSRKPGSGIYILQIVCSLDEAIDPRRLQDAWIRTIRRHAILRSSIELEPEGLFQAVREDASTAWDERDWSALSPDAYDRELAAFLQADRARGFDFDEGSPLRVTLIRRASARYQFIWTYHHALLDRRARTLVLQELFARYDADSDGLANTAAAAPPRPFADHVRWLREQDWQRAESYWRDRLRAFGEPIRLPIEAGRHAEFPGGEGYARQMMSLPDELRLELEALAASNQITLNTLVQAAWAILLGRYSGKRDVVFGATRACRRSSVARADTIIGPLLNTVPVRIVVAPDAMLLPWLDQLRAQWIALRDHENTPLAKIHEWSDVPKGVPLFETVVVFDTMSQNAELQGLGGSWRNRTVEVMQRSDTPLTLFGHSKPQLELGIAFDRGRFDPASIDRLLGHLKTLLEGFVRAPGSRLADLPMLSAAERHQILEVWNGTAKDYPRDAVAQHFFERQAQESPAQVAMIYGDRELSYGEANARANQLARHLQKLRVKPDQLVGVLLERSPEIVIALLAILKAGGAFLLLDPDAPRQRLLHVVQDAQLEAVITIEQLALRLDGSDAKALRLDTDRDGIAREPQHDLATTSAATNLAYAVYTSGSTGKPKGTLITHRALVNHTIATKEYYGTDAADRRIQFASVNSDVFILEVFTYLSSGSTLVFGFQSATSSIAEFLEFMDRNRITTVGLPASYWNEWVVGMADGEAVLPRALRLVVSGMEQVRASSYAIWQQKVGSRIRWCNAYGPSEATCTAAIFEASVGDERRTVVPIGKPIANMRLYLLDPDQNLVPVGVPGEIVIGGDGVARGYLNQPELNTARFVADPFSADRDARLYRTGDTGVWLPDGNIVFLGRLDEQVKIRGYRVELGEIESVLAQHPDIRQCAVTLGGDAAEPRLNAYVVLHPGRSRVDRDLRNFLAEQLPRHMIPAAIIRIDSLPTTPSGKVDRARLPSPSQDQLLPHDEPIAPRNDIERQIAAIVEEKLGRASIGVHTDFFSVGGDSLLAMHVASRIQSAFGSEFSVRDLFSNPTVAGLARVAQDLGAGNRDDPAAGNPDGGALAPNVDIAVAIVPTIREPAAESIAPLSHTQARAWFLHRLDPASSAYNEARLWRIEGRVDIDALRTALRSVAAHQSMLRTRFVSGVDGPTQSIDANTADPLEAVDLSGAGANAEQRLEIAIREHVARPFNLAAAPPLRWTLFDLGGDRSMLLRVWHHILGDAQSSQILQRELSEAYAAARARRDPALTALAIDYADYASWQTSDLTGPKLERLLDVWKTRLADLPALLLPTDFTRPPSMSTRGGVVTTRVSRDAATALKAIGRERGATPFVTFLTVFQTLLSRLSGQTDFAIGTPVAGRMKPEMQPVIGFFANTLVLRADLAGNPSTTALLQRTRKRVTEAVEHQEIPFEKLVEALNVPRDPSRNPLFQVAFAMRGPDADELRLEGATVHRAETGIGNAKFDLTVSLHEHADAIELRGEYCTDLFERTTIERMMQQYALLVEAMAADPERPVALLPMMDEPTRSRVEAAARPAAPSYPGGETIHRRFAAQAALSPAARAIDTLEYGALDAAANRLARELAAQGVARGAIVAVTRARSADVAIAWLAVLKVGAAYLPLDPDLPAERIAFMLDDARIEHAIADAPVASRFAQARPGLRVICPEQDAERIAAHDPIAPTAEASADDPAYVIYTSGSTGTPKGVVVPHRAVLRLVCQTDYVQLGTDDVVGQMANPAFDASTFEFWGALLNGARIAPIAKTISIAPRALAATIDQEGVTTLFITTALFNAVARDAPSAFRSCRAVLFGGEAVEPRWVRAVLAAGPPARLLHVYGPTETTTFATWHEIVDVAANAVTIPIGHAIANTQTCVVRPDLELAAPGEPGELLIGGPGVALGYLARPELTAERFVEHAAGPLPPGRWYRTGDRVRLRDDGAIEFLGRVDRQIKIRGHRVELDEIEAAIARLPQVREAAVSVRGETSDTRQIVAHLVRADASAPPPANILGELRRVLPDFMLPGKIIWMPSLPLNASGKVDRRALQVPEVVPTQRRNDHVPPRDMFERLLVRIWEDVLDIESVGIFDHFFEIGGHSLLAARLVDAIERETGLSVPLTAMFTDDTLTGLAAALRRGVPNAEAPILSFNASGTLPPFVFLHGDFVGGGFYSRALVQALGPEQPVLIVHPHGLLESSVPETIEAMAADRVRALRAIRPNGPYFFGGYCNGAVVAFEMARLLMEAGEDVPGVILIEARAPGGEDSGARPGDPPAWLTLDRHGALRVITPHDRQSDLWLRYLKALDRYQGNPFAGRLSILRSSDLRDPRHDVGWSRFASSPQVQILPGNHVTLITRHVAELAEAIRKTIDQAVAREAS